MNEYFVHVYDMNYLYLVVELLGGKPEFIPGHKMFENVCFVVYNLLLTFCLIFLIIDVLKV
jgi:hypothetical protein